MRPGVLAFALVCHTLLAAGYLFWTPLFEGPDENDHYYYAAYLSHRGELPVILKSAEFTGRTSWDEVGVGHHPPLYYGLLAVTRWVSGDADTMPSWRTHPDAPKVGATAPATRLHWLHGYDEVSPVSREVRGFWLLRAWSVLFGLVTIWLTHRMGRVVFPDRPRVADTAALLLACLPQWSFAHGVLDNGNLATTLSHATVLVLVGTFVRQGFSAGSGLVIGGLTGLALITKLNSLFLLPLTAFVYAVALWSWPAARRRVLGSGLVALAMMSILATWFFVRNWLLYGELLASSMHRAAFASNRIPEALVLDYLLNDFVPMLFGSTIGQFGWMSLPVPGWVLVLALTTIGASVLGLVLAKGALGARRVPVLTIGLAALLVFGIVVKFNLDFVQPQGRYLFPAIGCAMLLIAAGLCEFGRRLAAFSGSGWPRLVVLGLPPAVATAILVGHFAPAFAVHPEQASPHYSSLIADTATPVSNDRHGIDLLTPEHRSEHITAPKFAWRVREPLPGAIYSLQAYSPTGRILFGTWWLVRMPLADEFELPENTWDGLSGAATEILWQVRQVPDRQLGEEVADMVGSAQGLLIRPR